MSTPGLVGTGRSDKLLLNIPLGVGGSVAKNLKAALEPAIDCNDRLLQRQVSGTYNRFVKPIVGTAIALPLVLLLSPLLLAIGVAVVIDSGFPVLYRGERGGFRNRPFRILKFRTMVPNAELIGGGTTALGDARVTRVGRLLRKTKLDEFPQLINILKGEMCFVGPRPELIRYTSTYTGYEKYILQVRPGITDFSSIEYMDLAQVVGAEDADAAYERDVLRRKNQLRVQYIEQMSPLTDFRLFISTAARAVVGLAAHVPGRKDHHGDN